ncbi:hypothetical protein Cgig2_022564 [Carnegiea gigantea]|uniref:Uncharacterized protein n=1 Tax=Carnegiea gigantea TaxID=171969 RepID=A0A9Q1KLK9_9CARY|nr:hypothetical protein Cgig2_022564 [Carnegiea gigantea]
MTPLEPKPPDPFIPCCSSFSCSQNFYLKSFELHGQIPRINYALKVRRSNVRSISLQSRYAGHLDVECKSSIQIGDDKGYSEPLQHAAPRITYYLWAIIRSINQIGVDSSFAVCFGAQVLLRHVAGLMWSARTATNVILNRFIGANSFLPSVLN